MTHDDDGWMDVDEMSCVMMDEGCRDTDMLSFSDPHSLKSWMWLTCYLLFVQSESFHTKPCINQLNIFKTVRNISDKW